jgi:hypothetical protein
MPPDPPRWSRAFGVRFAPPKNEGLATPLAAGNLKITFNSMHKEKCQITNYSHTISTKMVQLTTKQRLFTVLTYTQTLKVQSIHILNMLGKSFD